VWLGVTSKTTELLSAKAVRQTSRRMLALADEGSLEEWTLDRGRIGPTVDFVAKVIRERYPTLRIPYHARWRHFVFGGRDLWAEIAAECKWESPAAAGRAAFDLAITSVLLDAGAGAEWRYRDSLCMAARSEGLALASLRWFERGGFADFGSNDPWRADAVALSRIDGAVIDQAFQVGPGNPLAGAHGRAALLNRLGRAVSTRPDLFAKADTPRPGGLFDLLVEQAGAARELPAAVILATLLEGLGPIWPGRPMLDGVSLGDCWPYRDGWVPLHKLSQWLAYSLFEPLEQAGIRIVEVGGLTGLAEYRNGGLFVDMGVLVPRDAAAYSAVHDVSDPFVVTWRSATVGLLDEIAPLVAERLGLTAEEFPLARVLEGGTWAAGRIIARDKRANGGPPFEISSDGTVF
jgi:hypothetical protein